MFQGCITDNRIKNDLGMFQRGFTNVPTLLHWCFNSVFRVFQAVSIPSVIIEHKATLSTSIYATSYLTSTKVVQKLF